MTAQGLHSDRNDPTATGLAARSC